MRSLDQARQRWQITLKNAASLDALKQAVKSRDESSNPCIAGLRSVCWKTFLLFQSTKVSGWPRALSDSRSAYTSLREHLLRYIENPDELGSALDPLDDDQHSPWNTVRQDEEIRAEIFQDVERCMPEDLFFRKPETQRTMLDILFVFCKLNQDVGYRQGMHELLAPILWVVEQDALEDGSDVAKNSSEADPVMKEMLDPAYIEHDAFTLLSLIMRSAKPFYELGEPDLRQSTPSMGSGTPQPGASPIVERSKRIHEAYLARLDPGLAKHLTDIEVLPQIFLIRWIRLLFGREFPFEELLSLWDVLLAEDPGLDLVDMVCVAMLLRIRWQLMEANYSMALMLLLKYPAPETPQSFVDDAAFLRDHFTTAGGSKIISKYSGREPSPSTDSRPSTPLGKSLSPNRLGSRTKSPLPSPARFLQQQGGVEALFQGAAKGVFARAERLGINQAVRDAVGEAKSRMEELQASRSNSSSRRTSDVGRWSLDQGRPVPSLRKSISATNARNKQLATMLEQVVADLRAASMSPDGDKEKYVAAMDIAVAKVEFVKVYLEDATIPLPAEPSPPPPPPTITHQIAGESKPLQLDVGSVSTPQESQKPQPEAGSPPTQPSPPAPLDKASESAIKPTANSDAESVKTPSEPVERVLQARPKAPVPNRSTIAQSSFSWMLEPDNPTPSGHKSPPPKSSSPFLKSGRRPTSGPNREKAAFLFGEDSAESSTSNARLPSLVDADEGFNLGTIKGPKTK